MRRLLELAALGALLGSLTYCSTHPAPRHFGVSAPTNLNFLPITWSGAGCVPMDGGSVTYTSDSFSMGGNTNVHMSGATITCGAPYANIPASGSVSAQLSTDNAAWFNSTVTPATIDGGYGDAGPVVAALVISSQSASYARVQLTAVASLNTDAGYFCDGGPTGAGIVGNNDGGCVAFYIDGGANFCDGGNFCDAGPTSYDLTIPQQLCCNAATVPE